MRSESMFTAVEGRTIQSPRLIIGITGKKGAGKDTAARYLTSKYGFHRIGFADSLKRAVGALFGVHPSMVDYWKNRPIEVRVTSPVPIQLSWREFLQRFGTEMGRQSLDEDIWVRAWLDAVMDCEDPIVAPDVRFANEAKAIHDLGGFILEVIRETGSVDSHESEAGIPSFAIDAWITNNGSLSELYSKLEAILDELLQPSS